MQKRYCVDYRTKKTKQNDGELPMYYISDMIWRVEQALADGRQTIAELTVSQVYATLNSEI